MGLPLLLQAVIAINLLRYVQLARRADGSDTTTPVSAHHRLQGFRGSGTFLHNSAREHLSEGRVDGQNLHVSRTASSTANHLTLDEAFSFLSTYFKELEPWAEQQQQQHPAAQRAVSAAALQLFTHVQSVAAEQRQWRQAVMSAAQQVQEGMKELQQAVCAAKEKAGVGPACFASPLPAFAATRRVALAAVHVLLGKLYAAVPHDGTASAELAKLIQQVNAVGQRIVMAAHTTEQCSLAMRPVLEALHVSKAGGSSMCELARLASQSNPNFNAGRNCMIDAFGDEPRWVEQAPGFVPDICRGTPWVWMFSTGSCTSWLQRPETTCAKRMETLTKHNITFYMNEVALHDGGGGGGAPGPAGQQLAQATASTCPGMRSLIVLRPPLERLASHMLHAKNLIERDMHGACEVVMKLAAREQKLPTGHAASGSTSSTAAAAGSPRSVPAASPSAPPPAALTPGWHLPPWTVPAELQGWQAIMPAAVDNYALRHLLGRQAHCVIRHSASASNESAFTGSDWAAGAAKLVAMDHVLLLPPAAGGASRGDAGVEQQAADTVMRVGLRWPWSLSNIHWRKAKAEHLDFEKHLGFPAGTAAALQVINKWDMRLYTRVARPALLLDASYYTTAALLSGCVATAEEAQQIVEEEEARLGTCPAPATPPASAMVASKTTVTTTTHVSSTVAMQTTTTHAAAGAQHSGQQGNDHQHLPPGVTWAWDAHRKRQSRSLLARINNGAGKLASAVDSMLRRAGINSPLVPLHALAPRSSKQWEQQAPVTDYVGESQNAPEWIDPVAYMDVQSAAIGGRQLMAAGSSSSPPYVTAVQRNNGPLDCHGRPVPRTNYKIEPFSEFKTNLGVAPTPLSAGFATAAVPSATAATTTTATAAAAAGTATATVVGSTQQQQQQQAHPGPYPLDPRFLLFGTSSRLAAPGAAHAFSFSSCRQPAAE